MRLPLFVFLPLLIGLVVLIPIVLILVLRGNRRNQTPSVLPPQTESSNPAERNSRREAILSQLAAKEITREEAELELTELDRPMPEDMPTAPPLPRKGCGLGCLIAFLIGIVVLFLLFFLMFFGLSPVRVQSQPTTIYSHETQEMTP